MSKKMFKGEDGYLAYKRKREIVKTIVYFFLPLSLFFAGWYSTGSRNNLLTIVAVLGLLPASKSAVTLIMYCKTKGCSLQNAEIIKPHIGQVKVLFDYVFTSYDKSFEIDCLLIKGHTICGFVTNPKTEESKFESWLEENLVQNGYKNYSVKIFRDIQKFTQRLDQLNQSQGEENKKMDGVLDLLDGISL